MSGLVGQTESARPRFIANLATVLGGQAANIVVALLTEICLARLLGPGPRGQVSLCIMAIWFGALLGGLGAEVPIVLWTADQSRKRAEWLSAVALCGLAGCIAAEFLWRFIYFRWHSASLQGVTPELANVVLFSIPLAILFNYLIAFLTGSERFRERAVVGILEGAVSLLGFLSLVWFFGRDAGAAMWGNWLGLAVGVAVAALLLRSKFSSRNWAMPRVGKETRSGLLVGLYGNFGNIAAFFNYRLDIFIVNYFLDPAHVGIYAVGVTVSESLWQIPQAAAAALFPRTARTVQQGATAFTCLVMRQVLLISCVCGVVLALVSPIAIPLVFGARFAASVGVIWWILPGTIALAASKVAASDLAGRHKTWYSSAAGLLAFGVTVALDLVLIPRWGIQGAAVASSAAYLVNTVLLLLALRHELKVGWAALLVPSVEELTKYKQGWDSLVAWSRIRGAALR